jgi:DNA end-binding protein Ku
MARPYWSGQIQISLVSFSVKLFVATEAKSDIRFHQIDRATGERVKHQKVLASAVERAPDEAAEQSEIVDRSAIVKGYEYSKGQYVTIEPEELAHLRVPSKHVMEIAQFVDDDEIDPEFYEKPYFVVPENESQTEAFETIRKALMDTKKIAISKIAFSGREHVVAIAPSGEGDHGGMMAYTMRYAAELRNSAEYFRDIKNVEVNDDSLGLAKELIKRKTGHFDASKFVDGYEVAVRELVDAKLKHLPVPKDEAPAPVRGKVINLMDALRKSVTGGGAADTQEAAAAATPAHAHKSARKSAAEPKGGLELVKKPAKAAAKGSKSSSKRKTA